ncbi:hypothetical protein [Lacrimispora sphenoides]
MAKVSFEPIEGCPVYCWDCLNNNH